MLRSALNYFTKSAAGLTYNVLITDMLPHGVTLTFDPSTLNVHNMSYSDLKMKHLRAFMFPDKLISIP